MSEKYSLRIKIGDAEFEAEGPEQTVEAAFQRFIEALESSEPSPSTAVGQPEPPLDNRTVDDAFSDGEVSQAVLDRAFEVDKDRGVVSLRFLPRTEGDQRLADAAVLIVYGAHKLLGEEETKVTKLNEGLKRSGLGAKRVDSYITVHKGLIRKRGQRVGSRYSLTHPGEQWSARTLSEEFPNR